MLSAQINKRVGESVVFVPVVVFAECFFPLGWVKFGEECVRFGRRIVYECETQAVGYGQGLLIDRCASNDEDVGALYIIIYIATLGCLQSFL